MILRYAVLLIAFLTITNPVYAASHIEINSLPESVQQDTKFSLLVEISASENSAYYIKVRGGKDSSSLRSVQTLNSSSNTWLTDTASWSKFPTISTDDEGVWSGSISAKFGLDKPLGENLLLVRIKKVGGGEFSVSQLSKIDVLEKPKLVITNNNLKVFLNEFSPAPKEGQEWVEIYNPNSQTVDLTGWKIDDIEKGSSPYNIPDGTKISAKGFKIFKFSNKLNNSGDTIRLINSSGKVLETYTFGKVESNTTFAKDPYGTWQLTTTPTPGKINKINQPPNSQVGSVESVSQNKSKENDPVKDSEILGVLDPNFLGEEASKKLNNPEIASANVQQKYSINIILIGFGLILLGLAFGAPLLQAQKKVRNG